MTKKCKSSSLLQNLANNFNKFTWEKFDNNNFTGFLIHVNLNVSGKRSWKEKDRNIKEK